MVAPGSIGLARCIQDMYGEDGGMSTFRWHMVVCVVSDQRYQYGRHVYHTW